MHFQRAYTIHAWRGQWAENSREKGHGSGSGNGSSGVGSETTSTSHLSSFHNKCTPTSTVAGRSNLPAIGQISYPGKLLSCLLFRYQLYTKHMGWHSTQHKADCSTHASISACPTEHPPLFKLPLVEM